MQLTDLFIIGGGINGVGIARDAVGRGLSVVLAEQNDLASATSSASTKLFHGGLRYLEYYEFRLVREALIEREILLNAMPHISWPMRFLLPLHKEMRPAWLLRIGLFIYDHLGGRKILPPTRRVSLQANPLGKPLKSHFARAFEYSDCWVQDARLVSLNARDAAERGAKILVQSEVMRAKRAPQGWEIYVQDKLTNKTHVHHAKVLINAAGPWVGQVIDTVVESQSREGVRLVRGSHIVTKKLFDHEHCYIFQNNDGRIAFAIPYENDFTLIGTTDIDHEGSPDAAVCSSEEVRYLCELISEYFEQSVTPDDVVHTYSGIRPLYDDKAKNAAAATRDYVLRIEEQSDLPLLNIFGGKITTYRKLAETAVEKLAPYFWQKNSQLSAAGRWTATTPLPGGDFPIKQKDALIVALATDYPFLDTNAARRLINLYGTDARGFLGQANDLTDLGKDFGWGLTEAEVRHLIIHEFARSADDILWRRTKLGLYFDEKQFTQLADWLSTNLSLVLASTTHSHDDVGAA